MVTKDNEQGCSPGGARSIAMLIYEGVAPLDVAGPLQVFGVANFLRGHPLYTIMTASPTGLPIQTRLGFAMMPTCAMADLPFPLDTLLISGGGGPDAGTQAPILDWVREAAPRVRRLGSICTGAFVLGAAGLIEDRKVTTHWAYADELARRNPTAKVDVNPIFSRAGNIYSSAGISAGIDLALSLVEEDHGKAFALRIARFLVLFLKRSGGQAQFFTVLQAQTITTSPIQKALQWALDHLDENLNVAVLAQRAGLGERSFTLLFTAEIGKTPNDYIMTARIEAACRMLEEGNQSPKAIASACGFGSSGALRQAFLRRLGVSPAQYRDKFQV